MKLNVHIEHVQHVAQASLEIDLSGGSIKCFVRRNGIGKTTLIKAIRNLKISDTFKRTSPGALSSH